MATVNLLSLLFGLAAWIIPVVLLASKKQSAENWRLISFMLSAGALELQITSLTERVHHEDWAGLLDTMKAELMVTAVLVTGTILLNGLVMLRDWRKEAEIRKLEENNS